MAEEHSFSSRREGNLHVFDLPQLYQKPSFSVLMQALESLTRSTQSFSRSASEGIGDPEGLPEYLTRIIASPLLFLSNDGEREKIWDLASQRLAERSGRSAMSDMTRSFVLSSIGGQPNDVRIHEPTMTSDNLGLKTWGTAYVLAQQLHHVRLPPCLWVEDSPNTVLQAGLPAVLELGAGTGLAGIAAAAAWRRHVLLTDLPAIVPNLAHNVELNSSLLADAGGQASATVLDWSQPAFISCSSSSADLIPPNHFHVIIAADPIYDPVHPRLLVNAIKYHLHPEQDVLVIVAYPIRDVYAPEIADLTSLLHGLGLVILSKNRETGRDDWKDDVEVEVVHWTRPIEGAAEWHGQKSGGNSNIERLNTAH